MLTFARLGELKWPSTPDELDALSKARAGTLSAVEAVVSPDRKGEMRRLVDQGLITWHDRACQVLDVQWLMDAAGRHGLPEAPRPLI